MKFIIRIAWVAAIILAVSACSSGPASGGGEAQPTDQPGSQPTDQVTIEVPGGLADTVWASVTFEGADGRVYADHLTLQGPDVYRPAR